MSTRALVLAALLCASCQVPTDGADTRRQALIRAPNVPIAPTPNLIAMGPGLAQSVDVGENIALVGVPTHSAFSAGHGSVMILDGGAQYIFNIDKLAPGGALAGAEFGFRVAAGNGWYAASAPGSVDGDVAVYTAAGALISSAASLTTLGTDSRFGEAMDAANASLIVGAPNDGGGTAHVYGLMEENTLTRLALLRPAGQQAGDRFGAQVAVRGPRMLVTAESRVSPGLNVGVVYLYDANFPDAELYGEVAQLAEPGGLLTAEFGASLGMGPEHFYVGVPDNDKVIVYREARDGAALLGELTGPLASGFGEAISVDGLDIFVGAPMGQATAGEVYWYRFNLLSSSHELLLTLQAPTPTIGEMFGSALGSNSSELIVAADDGTWGGPGTGAAYIYEYDIVGPTAVEDSAQTLAGVDVTIDVLANDLVGDGAFAGVSIGEGPEFGSVTNTNPFVFSTNSTQSGTASFQYRLTDEWGEASFATVTIVVTGTTDPLAWVAPTPQSTAVFEAKIGDLVEFTVRANAAAAYGLSGAPESSAFSPTLGTFSWTADEVGRFQMSASAAQESSSIERDIILEIAAGEVPTSCETTGCDAGETCFDGGCFPSCGGDADCAAGRCFDGRCAVSACEGVTCPAADVCYAGACFAACGQAEQCEAGESCFAGRCATEACAEVICPVDELCFGGACFAGCSTSAECGDGLSCFNGRCADEACADVQCAVGSTCFAGSCFVGCETDDECPVGDRCFDGRCAANACDGVQCPDGLECEGGTCSLPQKAESGCSCATASGSESMLWLLLGVAWLGRRRPSRTRQNA